MLPLAKRYIELSDIPSTCAAISTLAVRGAPLIGVAAALAVAHAARKGASRRDLIKGIGKLASTRPTAVNLFAALEEMKAVVMEDGSVGTIVERALSIWKKEETNSFEIIKNSRRLIHSGMRVGTYCNTGLLAAPGFGTALGVIIAAHLDGKKIEVIVPETRPLLQGARLTAWELSEWGVPYRLVTESALASVVGTLDACFVGADRIAANGDTANKVGTFGLAILCNSFGVPFYVVAPSSTIDLKIKNGDLIPIEHRADLEVLSFKSCRIAPNGAKALNPAFDVTPARLIRSIITERGSLKPPYSRSLRQ